eukprot:scaffold13760_cov137-Skeletonema_menzelii.AAC.4
MIGADKYELLLRPFRRKYEDCVQLDCIRQPWASVALQFHVFTVNYFVQIFVWLSVEEEKRREERRGEGGEKRRKICILALNSVGTYGTLWLSVACLSRKREREREREAAGGAALLFQTMVPRGVYFHDAVISTDQSSNIDKELIS